MCLNWICRIVFILFATIIGALGAYLEKGFGVIFWCSIVINALWGFAYGRFEAKFLKKINNER